MKPVFIFEHIASSGPGLFQAFIEARAIPFELIRPNEGDPIPEPEAIPSCSGLCFLGGIESLTRPVEWMEKEMDLIRAAKEQGTPVIGHCLGGQLISRALGGEVTQHHLEEFGWSRLYPEDNTISRQWLDGVASGLVAMQWHSDTFSLPAGATRILTGEFCANQAFIHGNMLGMQFHVEVTAATIRHWAIDLADKHPAITAGVQSGEQIISRLEANLAVSRTLAEQLYDKWASYL